MVTLAEHKISTNSKPFTRYFKFAFFEITLEKGASAVLLASENSSNQRTRNFSNSSLAKTDFRIFGRLFQDPTAEWE
jgi:hypothetical protein